MSKPMHTPEPWVIDGFMENAVPFRVSGFFKIRSANSMLCHVHVYSAEEAGYSAQDRADAERIVACVNAMEGIADPRVVPKMRAALASIECGDCGRSELEHVEGPECDRGCEDQGVIARAGGRS